MSTKDISQLNVTDLMFAYGQEPHEPYHLFYRGVQQYFVLDCLMANGVMLEQMQLALRTDIAEVLDGYIPSNVGTQQFEEKESRLLQLTFQLNCLTNFIKLRAELEAKYYVDLKRHITGVK